MELASFFNFLFSIHLWGGLLSNFSVWLLVTSSVVTILYEQIFKQRINELEGDSNPSRDYSVYLVLHIAVFITSFIIFFMESFGDIFNALSKNDPTGTIPVMIGIRIVVILLSCFVIAKYMSTSFGVVKAYKQVDHSSAFWPPKIFAAKLRLFTMVLFIVITAIELYLSYSDLPQTP